MKIKHWQGYGSVDVKKLTDYPINSFEYKIIIQVTGNHECGIVKRDVYDIWNWLLKRGERFDCGCKNYQDIRKFEVHGPNYNNANVETAIYEITYSR